MHRRKGARARGSCLVAGALIGAAYGASNSAYGQGVSSPEATVHASSSPALEAAIAPLGAPSTVLDAAEADIRTHWIQDRLDAETPSAQRWYWTFLTLSVGATAGQFVLGAASAAHLLDLGPAAEIGWYVGGVNALIGTIPMIIFPFRPAFAASELRHERAGTPQERVARMHRAEALLRECAEGEDFGSGWVLHALGVVLGVGSSMVLMGLLDLYAPHADRVVRGQRGELPDLTSSWITVATNLVATVAFNEIQVLTQPTQLVRDREQYTRDGWRTMAARTRRNEGVRITPVPYLGGAGVIVQF